MTRIKGAYRIQWGMNNSYWLWEMNWNDCSRLKRSSREAASWINSSKTCHSNLLILGNPGIQGARKGGSTALQLDKSTSSRIQKRSHRAPKWIKSNKSKGPSWNSTSKLALKDQTNSAETQTPKAQLQTHLTKAKKHTKRTSNRTNHLA